VVEKEQVLKTNVWLQVVCKIKTRKEEKEIYFFIEMA
jgi:hypothetical protein